MSQFSAEKSRYGTIYLWNDKHSKTRKVGKSFVRGPILINTVIGALSKIPILINLYLKIVKR